MRLEHRRRGRAVMVPQVTILSEDEAPLMHTRALDVLEKVGIRYESRRCLELLEAEGQRVDYDAGIAWIKPDLVERCVELTPRVITLAGRDPQHDMVLDGSRLRVTTNGQGTFTQDFRTGERRRGASRDLAARPRSGHNLTGGTLTGRMSVPSNCRGGGAVLPEC